MNSIYRYGRIAIVSGKRRLKKQGCRNYGCSGKGNIIPGRKTHRNKKYCPRGPIEKFTVENAKKAMNKRFDQFDSMVENLSTNLMSLSLNKDEEVFYQFINFFIIF